MSEKPYSINVENCNHVWKNYLPKGYPPQQRNCNYLGKYWDFPGRENSYFHRKKPTKKMKPYDVPDYSPYGKPFRAYSGGKTRRRRFH